MGPYWLLCRARFIKTKIIQIEPSPEKEVDQKQQVNLVELYQFCQGRTNLNPEARRSG
jgi:hypothetical protein